jgi:hypothetical protein
MKSIELTASFAHITIPQFREYMFYDPNFQKSVQEKMGQTNVVVGNWDPIAPSLTSQEEEIVQKRTIHFDSQLQAPAMVQSFLKTKVVSGVSRATMKSSARKLEGNTIMEFLTGLLKDSLFISIDWKAVPTDIENDPMVNMHVVINCEFSKSIPFVTSMIENSCATNAQNMYDTWIIMAKSICREKQENTLTGQKVSIPGVILPY